LEDETVEMAGYDVPHPLMTKATVYVRTTGRRRPETAMRDAAKKMRERSKELKKALEEAFEEYSKAASNS
jgi:DNA-directed RNA polymerase subunit L